jgi:regulator of RNase E activity RraA
MASPLEGLKTSRIVTSLQQLGYVGQFMTGVRPLTPANSFVGKARTLRLLPTRPDVVKAMQADRARNPNRVAVDQTQAGDVLVIDARGVGNHAVGGDPFAARVKGAGGVAFVTDGAVRNLPGLLALNFPIYAQGVHSSSLNNAHIGISVNEPIACGGVLVLPGDIIVGDAEGVVVVPADLEAQSRRDVAGQRGDRCVQHRVAAPGRANGRGLPAESGTTGGVRRAPGQRLIPVLVSCSSGHIAAGLRTRLR